MKALVKTEGPVAPLTKHYGPGPHKSGSPQSVHGGSGSRGSSLSTKLVDTVKLDTLNLTTQQAEGLRSEKYRWMQAESDRRGWDMKPYHAIDEALDQSTDSLVWSRDPLESAVSHVRSGADPVTNLQRGVVLQRAYTDAVWEAKYGDAATIPVSRVQDVDSDRQTLTSWTVRENEGAVVDHFDRIDDWHLEHDQEVPKREVVRRDVPKSDVYILPWGEARYRSDYVTVKGEVLVYDGSIAKHYGPGPHPGTGTPQSVHGSGNGGKSPTALKASEWRSLNRHHPERDGEIAEKLIVGGNDAAKSVTSSEAKDEVVRSLFWRLSGDSDVREYASAYMRRYEPEKISHYDNPVQFWIDSVVKGWAEMDEMELDAINVAVADVFGEGYWPDRVSYDALDEHLSIEGSDGAYAYRELVKAMHDQTQLLLSGGPDRYVFFRGLRGRRYSGDLADSLTQWVEHYDTEWGGQVGSFPGMVFTDVALKGRPAASWSASYSTAKEFAQSGVILAVSVPREAIISTARTGLGALFEDEVLLIDHGENVVTAISSSQTRAAFDQTKHIYGNYSGNDALAAFPSALNTKVSKIAWTNAYLDGFHNRGVWVDTEVADPFKEDISTEVKRIKDWQEKSQFE